MSLSRPLKTILQGPFNEGDEFIENKDFIHRLWNYPYHQSQDLLLDMLRKFFIAMCLHAWYSVPYPQHAIELGQIPNETLHAFFHISAMTILDDKLSAMSKYLPTEFSHFHSSSPDSLERQLPSYRGISQTFL